VSRQHAVDRHEQLPQEGVSHAVREYLAVLDDAAFSSATPVAPKQLAVADPASRWTAATRERAFFAYSTNYLIDLEHAVIIDVEATTSVRQAEVTAQRRMIDRVQARFGLRPERLTADASYGDAANLAWLVEEKGIAPHIPVFDKSARTDGTFERSAFTFDQKDDRYICPGGKRLRPRNRNFTVPGLMSIKTASFGIARASRTVATALYASAARPTCRLARSCDQSMKAPATWRAISRRLMPTSLHGGSERMSRCCLRTSNAS
jgi:hypothetical protein